MKMEPPPATRLMTPSNPPPPPNCVCVVIWIVLPIHESSPASEMMDSLWSRMNSRTGMVVPVMRLCMADSPAEFRVRKSEYTTRRKGFPLPASQRLKPGSFEEVAARLKACPDTNLFQAATLPASVLRFDLAVLQYFALQVGSLRSGATWAFHADGFFMGLGQVQLRRHCRDLALDGRFPWQMRRLRVGRFIWIGMKILMDRRSRRLRRYGRA